MTYPSAIDTDTTLYLVVDLAETTLASDVNSSVTTITLTNASRFPSSGTLRIWSGVGTPEFISYSGKSGNDLTGVTRGILSGFPAATHASGESIGYVVLSSHHNALKDAIIAVQQTLGVNPQDVYSTVSDRIAGHVHDARYYTETEIDALLSAKSSTGHTHDDRYYTESELQTAGQSAVHWDNLTNKPSTFTPPDNVKLETIGITVDGAGSVLTSGTKGFRTVDFAGTIQSWTIIANVSGSVTFDVKKSTYANFPTTSSIVASAAPILSSAQKAQSSTLTDWTTTIAAGDVIEFAITDTPSTVTRATLLLKVIRS